MPPDWVFVLEPVFGILVGGGLLLGVYKTVNRWLERKHERAMAQMQGGVPPSELERLRAQLDTIEDLAYRLQDVEERLEFAERVLASQQDRDQLPAGE